MSKLGLIKKFFDENDFEVDGFVYDFIKVEKMEDFIGSYEITINVSLPEKGQSYVVGKFFFDVMRIIEELQDYIGSFSMTLIFLVDMKRTTSIFLRNELSQNFLNEINKKGEWKKGKIYFDLRFVFFSNSYNYANYSSNDEQINLEIGYYLKEKEKINSENRQQIIDYFSGAVKLDHNLTSMIEEKFYEIMEPELQISKTDITIRAELINLNNNKIR